MRYGWEMPISAPLDLDTFLVTVYCVVDDLYRAHAAPHKPVRPGHRPELADSEVLTLLVLAQWQQGRSERAFLRYACGHWHGYFPRLLSQSAFNRRARDLLGVVCLLGPLVSQGVRQELGITATYEVVDGVAIPLMRRCRGEQHRLFGLEAGIGRGGSDREWYYGVHLLGAINSAGLITGFVVGPAPTAEHWLAEALFRWREHPRAPAPTLAELEPVLERSHAGGRVGPTGPIAPRLGVGRPSAGPWIGDRGFRGDAWRHHWRAHYGVSLLTRTDYELCVPAEQQRWDRWLSGRRQIVETVFQWLEAVFGLRFPRARTYWGLLTRLAAKVAAFDLAVYINYRFSRPPFAFFNPLG
jgi:hypothetical protein